MKEGYLKKKRRTDFGAGSCCAGALADADIGGDGVEVGGGGCDAHGDDYAVVLCIQECVWEIRTYVSARLLSSAKVDWSGDCGGS